MTRIALVRHGETDWNRAHRVQGHTNIPLNDEGRLQARRTAETLRTQRWDAVYSSPLARAGETAQIIADTVGLAAPTIVDELIERAYGEAEGLTRAELDARYPSDVLGREPRADAAARAVRALTSIAREHPGGDVLVVSHGGLIRAVLTHLAPADGDHHTEPIPTGSAHSLVFKDDELSLVAFNDEFVTGVDGDDITEENAVEARESSRG